MLRALAVILMVEQHLGVWLLSMHEATDTFGSFLVGLNSLGGAAAPLFITLSGVGVALGRQGKKTLLRRGIGLLLCGYALNLAVPSWFSGGSWYVLHLLGLWLLIAPGVRRLPSRALWILAGLIVVVGVLGQIWLLTPRYLPNQRLSDLSLPGGALRLAAFEGHFPVFPWLALAVVGLWGGRQFRKQHGSLLWRASGLLLLLAGLTQLPMMNLGRTAARSVPWRAIVQFSFYPATPAYLCVLGALCLALVALALKAEHRGWVRRISGMRHLGRTSLTLLCFHIIVFREGSTALGWRNEFAALPTLSLIAFVLLVWTWIAEAWARSDYRYSLEWWLRRL